MNVEGIDGQRGLSLSKTIQINVSNDVARWATIGVLEDSRKVALNGYGGSS